MGTGNGSSGSNEQGEDDEVIVEEEPDEIIWDDDLIDEGEEGVEPNVLRVPVKPSREEVMKHNTTHIPFRSWCPHCNAGKSKGRLHTKQNKKGDQITTLTLDFMWMTEIPKQGEKWIEVDKYVI